MPAIGSSRPRNERRVGAWRSRPRTARPRAARRAGRRTASHSSSDQSPCSRSNSRVRRGVGDVGDVPGAAGHPGDQVGVDRADRVAAVLDQRPRVRLVLGQPDQLGAGEVGVEPQPGQLARPGPRGPPRAAACRWPAVRRSCQTIARRGRAQRLAVPEQHRLALVGDADAGEVVAEPSHASRPSRVASRVACQISSGECSTQPGSGKCWAELLVALRGDRPLGRSTTRAVTPVVPASMASMLIRASKQTAQTWTGRSAPTRRTRSSLGSMTTVTPEQPRSRRCASEC